MKNNGKKNQVTGSKTHLFLGEAVLLPQHRVQRPEPQLPDPPQLPRAREELLPALPGLPHPLRDAAAELADEREVVVVALVVLAGARVEEQVARGELEDEAGEGPHVGRGGVLGAEEDLVVVVVVVGGFFGWFGFVFPGW